MQCEFKINQHFLRKGIYIMSNTNEASGLHKQAAIDHEEAAKHHRKAAECHDQNKLSDAKGQFQERNGFVQ